MPEPKPAEDYTLEGFEKKLEEGENLVQETLKILNEWEEDTEKLLQEHLEQVPPHDLAKIREISKRTANFMAFKALRDEIRQIQSRAQKADPSEGIEVLVKATLTVLYLSKLIRRLFKEEWPETIE